MDKKIVITKVGDVPIELPKEGGKKTMKSFPRGILKRSSKINTLSAFSLKRVQRNVERQ